MSSTAPSLLIPLDGSRAAEAALEVATSLPLPKEGGTLHLVSVVSPFPFFRPSDPYTDETPGWFAEEGARTRSYLEEVAARIEEASEGRTIEVHAPVGRPVSGILEVAEKVGADLLVMTPSGRSGLLQAWVGSVADRVMREAPCPVLLLVGGGDAPELSSLLVALDEDEASERVLEEAVALVRGSRGKLTLASVIPRPDSIAVPYLDLSAETERIRMDREAAMRDQLEALATPLREAELPCSVVTSRADEVVPGLLRIREEVGAGLLCLGTRGQGGLSRLVLGSVATRMVRASPVPLLLVPPPAS